MNELSLNEKRTLLSLAKRIKSLSERTNLIEEERNNIVNKIQRGVLGGLDPMGPNIQNNVRRLRQLKPRYNYHVNSLVNLSRKMVSKYGHIHGVTNQNVRVLANLVQKNINNTKRRHTTARAPVRNLLQVVMSPNRSKRMANQHGMSQKNYLKSLGLN